MPVDIKDWAAKQEAALHNPHSIAESRQLPGDPAEEGPVNPPASVALARIVEPTLVSPRLGSAPSGLEAAFLTFLQSKIPTSLVPVERRLFLTIPESSEFSGLPAAFLRRLIASAKLKALKTGAGWRVSRVELEKLSGMLADVPEELEEHQLRDIEINRRRRQGYTVQTDLPDTV